MHKLGEREDGMHKTSGMHKVGKRGGFLWWYAQGFGKAQVDHLLDEPIKCNPLPSRDV
jgi:hypothetical protein